MREANVITSSSAGSCGVSGTSALELRDDDGMAKQIVETTEYTDDLDGSVAAETIQFSFGGTAYEIDLSRANAKAFAKTMAPYIGAARKVRAPRRTAAKSARRGGVRDLGEIREWASQNGYQVSERGRVAGAVLDAYDADH